MKIHDAINRQTPITLNIHEEKSDFATIFISGILKTYRVPTIVPAENTNNFHISTQYQLVILYLLDFRNYPQQQHPYIKSNCCSSLL